MKRLLLGFAFAATMTASPVLAADLDEPPPPDFSPIYDWSGIYVGVFGGLVFVETPYVPIGGGDPEFGGASGIAGVLAGAQWQWDNFVLGVEGDWGWGFGETAQNIIDETDYTINSVATLRARLGFAFDDTMIYATGGVATANATLDAYVLGIDDDQTHWGWVIGGGMEHAFSENFTGRLEYLYASFGEEDYDLSPFGTVAMEIENMHIIRAALAYKFSL
ncbi:MAG: outer membrane protein [Aestuariivirga sp.]